MTLATDEMDNFIAQTTNYCNTSYRQLWHGDTRNSV